nr:hypothetical protein [Tanacetum cinerariifolium]
YNILKQNQGDVNDAMRSKKKSVVVTSDPLALIAEKTNVSRSKEKVVVSLDSEGSEADDFSKLKKITALLAKAFNQRKFYSKPTNNNLRTSSSSQSANKKQEYEGNFAKDCKKAKVKDYEYYKTKILLAKKDKDEQVLLAEDQAWMESSSDSDQEINVNMVFIAQIKKVFSDSKASSSSADEKISEKKYAKLKAERYEYMIRYSAYFDNDKQHRKQIADQQVLYDKMSVQLVELDKHQTSSLKPYVPNVILEKIIIDLEDEIVNLLEKEKVNLETIKSLKSKGFESSENFLETVRFGNNDFAMIAGYGDVVIDSMTIKKVYYVDGLGHNLFSVGQFFNKGLEVAFRKSTCFVRNEDGVDLLTDDRSSNLYTIALNEVASNSSTCLLAKASSLQSWLWNQYLLTGDRSSNLYTITLKEVASNSLTCLLEKASSLQSWLWHQRLSHLNFATINNLVKNNLVQGLPKMKFEKDHLCSACEQGKIHRKHHMSKTSFASNKHLYLLHMDLCGPMRV